MRPMNICYKSIEPYGITMFSYSINQPMIKVSLDIQEGSQCNHHNFLCQLQPFNLNDTQSVGNFLLFVEFCIVVWAHHRELPFIHKTYQWWVFKSSKYTPQSVPYTTQSQFKLIQIFYNLSQFSSIHIPKYESYNSVQSQMHLFIYYYHLWIFIVVCFMQTYDI